MRVSVVTVCFNSGKTIRRCIESVLNIDSSDFEYLIIDGVSTDDTVTIAKEYKQNFKEKGIKYIIISEKDTGIYNAMNKAINIAEGEWVLFLNSDDYFYNSKSLEKIINLEKDIKADVIYGNVIVKFADREIFQKPRNLEKLRSGTEMPFCHQSTFTKLSVLKQYRFNEEYKIIADIDSFLRMYEHNLMFYYIDQVISVFSNDGLSQTHRIESIKEGIKLLKAHNCYNLRNAINLNLHLLWYKYKHIINK